MRFTTSVLFILLLTNLLTGQEAKTAASVYNEGLAQLKEKNYEVGLSNMEEAITLAEADENEKVLKLAKKNGAVAAANVGNAKRKAGDLEAAMSYYEKGIALNPDNASNYRGIGMVYDKQNKKIEAVKSYLTAAKLRETAEKPKKAKKVYKAAKTIIGKLYTDKSYDDAIAAADLFIAQNDNNADVHYYASRAHIEKGNFDKGIMHADKAITISGSDVKDKYFIAKAKGHQGKGQKAEAISAYKKVTGEKYLESAQYQIKQLEG